jgi:hypothetical protein
MTGTKHEHLNEVNASFGSGRTTETEHQNMTTEQLEQQVLDKLHRLPREKRIEVLDFVTFLAGRERRTGPPRRSLKGLWADLGVNVSAEDIAGARREMWSGFPGESV